MNCRHVAALALVGWYLLLPTNSPKAPLSQWKQAQSFDTAADCEAYTNVTMTKIQNGFYDSTIPDPGDLAIFKNLMVNSLCVSTDDPRLKSQ